MSTALRLLNPRAAGNSSGGSTRSRLLVGAVALLGLVAAACEVGAEITIQVEEDGSGLVSVGVGVDVPTATSLGGDDGTEGYESLVNLEDLEAAGWDYSGLSREANDLWHRASKPFGNPEELADVLAEAVGPGVFSEVELERESAFARQNWSLTGEVNAVQAVLNVVGGDGSVAGDGSDVGGIFEFVRALDSFELEGEAGADPALALSELLSFRLEILLPGDLSEGSGPEVIELDSSTSPTASIRVLSEANDTTARTVRYLAYAAVALFAVTVLLSIAKWGYVRRKRKHSSKVLMGKAAREERRAKRAARARRKAEAQHEAPTVELKEEEFVSFAAPAAPDAAPSAEAEPSGAYTYEGVEGAEAQPSGAYTYEGAEGADAEPSGAYTYEGVEGADAQPSSPYTYEGVEGAEGVDPQYSTEAGLAEAPAGFTEAETGAAETATASGEAAPLQSPTDAWQPEDAPTSISAPAVVTPPSPSRQLQLLCVGIWGVLLDPSDPVRELLTPFVKRMGSAADENVLSVAYREATRGRTTPELLWSDCGLDGPANWPAGGPGAESVRVRPGAREFLERTSSSGIYVAAIADGVGGWIRNILLAQKVVGIHTLLASDELGLSETEPEVLRMLEAATGIPPTNCLVIHTRGEVLDAAASLGMSTLNDFPGLGAGVPTAV